MRKDVPKNNLFKGNGCRIAYALIYLDGLQRAKELGITRTHYERPEVARVWYKDMKIELCKDGVVMGSFYYDHSHKILGDIFKQMMENAQK